MFSLNFRKLVGFLLSLLIGIFIYQVVLPENLYSEDLFLDNFETYPTILIQQTIDDSQTINQSIFDQAIRNYQQENFEVAALDFEKLQEGQENDIFFQFYEGVSQLGAYRNGDAIQIFYKLLSRSDHLLVEQSRWYLALTYLQYDDWASTKRELKKIQPDAYKYKEAQKLFKRINAIQKKKSTVE